MKDQELINAGIDLEDLMNRLMGNAALVRILVRKFLEDKNQQTLMASIASGDMTGAEHACHTLKGMCGNMSLKALFELYVTQLNLFRSGRQEEAVAMAPHIDETYRQTTEHMRAWLNAG